MSSGCALCDVRAFRMRGTAFLSPVTSGASIVGTIAGGVGTEVGVGDGVSVSAKTWCW